MSATVFKTFEYLGKGRDTRLICAGKYLEDGCIAFVDRHNSLLLITNPNNEHTQEIDLQPLIPTFHLPASGDIPKPSDVNGGFQRRQLLITFTGEDFSLGIVCDLNGRGRNTSLNTSLVVKVKERTRSIVAIDGEHFCASTRWKMVVMNKLGEEIAFHQRSKRDRGGLLMTDGRGRFYYGDGDVFVGCQWNGEVIQEIFRFTDPRMRFPRGSAIDSRGRIVVCCDTSRNIFEMTSEGTEAIVLQSVRSIPYGDIDFHPNGQSFFTSFWQENEWPLLYRLS